MICKRTDWPCSLQPAACSPAREASGPAGQGNNPPPPRGGAAAGERREPAPQEPIPCSHTAKGRIKISQERLNPAEPKRANLGFQRQQFSDKTQTTLEYVKKKKKKNQNLKFPASSTTRDIAYYSISNIQTFERPLFGSKQ